jgi:hypothetical protein
VRVDILDRSRSGVRLRVSPGLRQETSVALTFDPDADGRIVRHGTVRWIRADTVGIQYARSGKAGAR